ncbi:similar to NACHT domain protein [Botrytis cinerea T4]|uniref:Similar to NACHT domain protein n=1 Tax=Botryotinia fuckeliana (strain T4) TaxID=999810 RepID=G2YEC3_BOTF4|nr:similar to NACHT domain protein [Botrytis cinerea T4]
MASPQNTIAGAFKRLKSSISEQDAHNFASTELKDVWLAVREIDSTQRQRQSGQNLRRIEPLLRGVEKYSKIVDVLCNGTPYLSFIWAPIKLMLQIASHHRDIFEALILAYVDIGEALPRFDRYQKAFDNNVEFQQSLATVYTNILEFHQRAYKFLRQRAWHVIFLSFWKDFGSRFDSIINSLKKHREFIDIEAVSFDIVESRESRAKMQDDIRLRQKRELEMVEENEKNAKATRLQHAIAWFNLDGKDQEAVHDRIHKKRHDKTCEWMAREHQFKNWMENNTEDPCLWLHGKPGSERPGLTTCYYYCDSRSSGNVCQQILKTVAVQLLRQHHEISTLVANEFVYRGVDCTMTQLRTLVPQLLQTVASTRIVVDGLDECSKEDQKLILKELRSICIGPALQCKILFSSRKEAHIRQKLLKQPHIALDSRQEVNQDIQSYLKYKVSKLDTSDQDLLSRIENTLMEKANGMFLWVRLVLGELKFCYSDEALEKTVMSLPKGLKAAYGRILDRIMDPSNPETARFMAIRILEWMACCYRVLKNYEILDGVAIDRSNWTLTSKTKIGKRALDLCRPLIEDGPANTVEFVHFSVREYLLEEEYQEKLPFLSRENANLSISFSCIAILNSCDNLIPSKFTEAQRAVVAVKGFHGLLTYAITFWYKHLLECFQKHSQLPAELLDQLQYLLRYRKENITPKDTKEEMRPVIENQSLQGLSHLPEIRQLILDILGFKARSKLHLEAALDKSPETISTDLCEMDPTHLSAIGLHFQRTIESLLGSNALTEFPNINQRDIQILRETYGASVFLCRYLNCVRNVDGFETSSQRDKHESHHQRRYQCAHLSCAYYTRGFVTRALLNKHNKKYHSPNMNEESPSLAEILATRTEPLVSDAFQMNNKSPESVVAWEDASRRSQPSFDAVVESNNPMNVNSDVLNDFDFDSFLNDTAGVADDNFNFDPYLGENEISDDISTHDELRN